MVTQTELETFIRKRKHFKVTQAELAEALEWRKETVIQYESGRPGTTPSEDQLALMEDAIDRVHKSRAEVFAGAV